MLQQNKTDENGVKKMEKQETCKENHFLLGFYV